MSVRTIFDGPGSPLLLRSYQLNWLQITRTHTHAVLMFDFLIFIIKSLSCIYTQYKQNKNNIERKTKIARAYCMIVEVKPHHQSLVHSSTSPLIDPLMLEPGQIKVEL